NASLVAAADALFAEGFGLCCEYDPSSTTPDQFIERIGYVVGGSMSRDLTTGEWHFDLARGEYELESLPVLTDDDVLEFRELPRLLDRATNSVSVTYMDAATGNKLVAGPVRVQALCSRFGERHETLDMPEIPNAALALRRATMEV